MSSSFASGRVAASLVLRLFAGAAVAALGVSAAQAQETDPYETDPYEDVEVEELVVSASRGLPNGVPGDIAPELVISPREIRAYGAATVTELLDALSPQLSSGQGSGGRPVVLINGGRTSGFREVRDLPTEAIARVDILPEEVSLRYGYPAEQKVVNIVLRERFRAWLVEASATTPTQSGGGETLGEHLGLLRIREGQRLMLDAQATQTSPIYESDRNVAGGEGAHRSLQSESDNFVLNAVYARPLGEGVSGSINGTWEASDSESRLGLSPFSNDSLLRRSQSDEGALAASAAGALAGWQWSYTGELSYALSKSTTDRSANGLLYQDETRSETTSAQTDIVLNRALWDLPAGRMSATFKAGAAITELETEALRAGVTQSSDLSRSSGQFRASFDAPLTRAGEGLGEAIGKLSGNFNVSYEHLSDFGGLQTIGGGLNWTPASPVRVLVSYSRTDEAPTMNQIGDPVTATPGTRVFDLERGETVEVTRITGGLSGLDAGRTDVLKLGLTYKPFSETNLNFQANFVSSRTYDAIVSFPSASTLVEQAFPDRFVRDADGVLTQIDARPVNFAKQSRDELRWGFTYSRPVGQASAPSPVFGAMRQAGGAARAAGGEGAAGGVPGEGPPPGAGPDGPPPDAPPPGAGAGTGAGSGAGSGAGAGMAGAGPRGPGGPGGFGGFGGGPRSGVFQLGLYHTLVFRDDVLIRPGLPELDLLDGGALGQGGGTPQHKIDLQANFSRAGLGVAMNASWESGTKVVGGTLNEELEFSDLATVNLRLFADLGMQPIAREHRWLRGARVTLSVDNLFDSRQEVRNTAGATPISYQPDLLDPVGRSVRLTLRKLIF